MTQTGQLRPTHARRSAGSGHSVDPAKLKHWRLNAFNIRARQRGRLQPRGHRRCPKNLPLQTNPCIPLAVIVTLIVVETHIPLAQTIAAGPFEQIGVDMVLMIAIRPRPQHGREISAGAPLYKLAELLRS